MKRLNVVFALSAKMCLAVKYFMHILSDHYNRQFFIFSNVDKSMTLEQL